MTPDLSVVIPACDEVRALGPLMVGVGHVLEGRAFEVIVVDDGSRDGTHHLLERLVADHPWLRTLSNRTSVGQSSAIRTGVRAARAVLIVTLDGDGQNPPDRIPLLSARFDAGGAPRAGVGAGPAAGAA